METCCFGVMPTRARALGTLLALCAAPCVTLAQSLTYLVGADAAVCDFADIQSAINAAQNHAGADTIRIARNQSYTGLALKIGQDDLTLEGGFATCADALIAPTPTSQKTVLSGLGAPQDSVLEISGAGVRVLRGFLITNGDDSLSGGGIQFNGRGELQLENVDVSGNASAFGGGINFHGTASPAALIFGPRVRVQGNTASESGGGVRVTGRSSLLVLSDFVEISDNEAQGQSSDQQGHGGGILVVGPADAEIASPGRLTKPLIHDNQAKYGGGLAVLAPDDGSATAVLHGIDAQRPLLIADNRASIEGGALFLSGERDTDPTLAAVNAFGIRIEGNRAPQGAAISLQESAILRFNPVPAPPGAVGCAPDVACSRIANNRSETIAGVATEGAIVFVSEEGGVSTTIGRGRAQLNRVTLQDNVGGNLLRGLVDVHGGLLARNRATGSLAVFNDNAGDPTSIREVTVASNVVDGPEVFLTGIPLLLSGSIIDQPGRQVAVLNGGSLQAENLLVSSCGLIDCAGFPGVTARATGARFIDPERGDFRLQAASVAADFAAPVVGDDRDVDGNPRDQDLTPKPDRDGVRDLGAFERQSLEPLVRNGDFIADLRLWEVAEPQATATFQTGVGFLPGGGVLIADDNDSSRDEIVGLRQCVALPGPGFYAITALAAGQGFLAITRDRPRLRWSYFAQTTSNACTGTPTLSGEGAFPNSSDLSPLSQPIVFGVMSQEFNERTQVLIELVAIEGNPNAANDSTAALFDAIRVFPRGAPDALFADGFEDGP